MAWKSVGPGLSISDAPILFVFGAARSGTTILNVLLDRHFGYGMGPEGTFVAQWARRLPKYGDLRVEGNLNRLITDVSNCEMLCITRYRYGTKSFDVTPSLIRQRLRERSYAGVVYSVFECMAELQGRPRIGNKNPDYWRQHDLLDRLFPVQAKYLGIVRDGRDVALSILKMPWGVSSAYSAAKVWVQSLIALEKMKSRFGPGRLHTLSYEKMLREPRATFEEVRSFLQVPVQEADIDGAVDELTHGTRSDNFDKWKDEMSTRDLRLFEGIAGEWLQKYGYQLSGSPTNVTQLEKCVYEAKEFQRLLRLNLSEVIGLRRAE
jgi:Sulfotransferase family